MEDPGTRDSVSDASEGRAVVTAATSDAVSYGEALCVRAAAVGERQPPTSSCWPPSSAMRTRRVEEEEKEWLPRSAPPSAATGWANWASGSAPPSSTLPRFLSGFPARTNDLRGTSRRTGTHLPPHPPACTGVTRRWASAAWNPARAPHSARPSLCLEIQHVPFHRIPTRSPTWPPPGCRSGSTTCPASCWPAASWRN